MSLTPKQQRFVNEYLVDLNATQAAIRAGYSAKTAESAGPRLLGNVRVAAAIQVGKETLARATAVTAERVINELANIAFADTRRFYDAEGNLRPIHTLDDAEAAALQGVDMLMVHAGQDSPPDVIRKIRRFDKISALTKLGEHLGIFKKAETPLFSIADVLDVAERRLERMKAQQAQPKEDKSDEE